MLFTSVALCAGFAVVLSSEFAPLVALGGLTALTMLLALLGDLILLPALSLVVCRKEQTATVAMEPMPLA